MASGGAISGVMASRLSAVKRAVSRPVGSTTR